MFGFFKRHHHEEHDPRSRNLGKFIVQELASIHHHLKAIAMNQQDELATIGAINDKLTAVESGIAGLQTKVSDLQDALNSQGSFVPQPVADALSALQAHVGKMASAFGGTDSPSSDSPATPTTDTSSDTPTVSAVRASAVGANTTKSSGR